MASAAAGSSASAMSDFGPGCSAVPKSGAGSFTGMATAPVATAASANPALSTLVTAVKKAGLVDTLNSATGITVFAPDNAAFAKIPSATLNKVLAEQGRADQDPHLPRRLRPLHARLSLPSGKPIKTLEGGTVTPAKMRRHLHGQRGRTWSAATCRPPTPPSTSSARC